MASNDSGVPETGAETLTEIESGATPAGSIARDLRRTGRRLARVRHIGKITAAVAVIGLLGAGYALGGPPATSPSLHSDRSSAGLTDKYANGGVYPADGIAGGPTSAPSMAAAMPEFQGSGTGSKSLTDGSTGYQPITAAADGSVIIKTGSLSLEVSDVDRAVAAAQTAVLGAGGYVSSSNRSGGGDYASAVVTFRIPAAKWDETLATLRKVGSKVLSEQTDASDVTMQVVDLNARIDNLQKSEQALQAIMARASSVPDVLAVQNQLSQTQGEIEQLTAQRDHLNDQAAMSTLAVSMSLPSPTVTVQATQDWTLGDQVDQAAAALVRIGQGIATIAVWAIVVALPVAFGVLILFGVLWVTRRVARRGSRTEASA